MTQESPTYPRVAVTGEAHPQELIAREEEAAALAERFQALSDPIRIKALHLLHTRGEMCACELQVVLGVTASNLSFHLQALRHARFVKSRKDGKRIFYRLAPGEPRAFLADFAALFPGEPAPGAACSAHCDDLERDSQ